MFFGDIVYVKDWFEIKGCVGKFEREYLKRFIYGLDCIRVEVSGSRFWSFFKEYSKLFDNFFY